ncbi:hypothetical protein E1B28_009128 [Marasmius oreades]|uniref:Uncharacterized protein n=1 Tax=Marasmius oreades TaxID=181124 RepID=A0A9P7S0F1_9AGAR|nr:uncharacterized protein E1B28_009128 [Marasmius oreades]KAG7092812.1 hypothetical protein E1B28_009128 [Marasmius oreades]
MPSSPPLRITTIVCFVALASAQRQGFDDEDRQRSVSRTIAGVIIGLVILLTILSCWLYSARRRRLAQFARNRTHHPGVAGGFSNPYDVSNFGWTGPPPSGPPPPGYTPTPHPGHDGPYLPPPRYGDKLPDGEFRYPPPPGSPPTGSQQYPPPPGPPPQAHVLP